MAVSSAIVSVLVVLGFGHLAIGDIRSRQVVVNEARAVTALALGGLGLIGLLSRSWASLLSALVGAGLILAIQLVPYLLQQRRSGQDIGRADVRLAVPFGWTLGYHGLGFAFVGFAAALLAGLVAAALTGQRRIPFVPFMTGGLVVGLGWALAVA